MMHSDKHGDDAEFSRDSVLIGRESPLLCLFHGKNRKLSVWESEGIYW